MQMHTQEEINVAYKLLAEPYLFRKYGIDKLDKKFGDYPTRYIPATWRSEMAEELELQFFSLLNKAHTDRLSGNEMDYLICIINDTVDAAEVIDYIENTYRKVLAGSLVEGAQVEYFQDIYDRGVFPGDAIIFVFSDMPEYDENGARDSDKEGEKTRVFNSVKAQFEDMVNADGGEKIILTRY